MAWCGSPGTAVIPIVDDIPANPANPKAQLPNIALIARTGTIWRSDWIASFTSIRRDGPFAMIPGGPMMDLSMSDVIPHHVMTGFWAWEFDGAVQAGLVVGWVYEPAVLIGTRRVGRGWVVASTFRLRHPTAAHDPVAMGLFDALIQQALHLVPDV